MIETFAPAKINLYLHVTGRRSDGYHFLDSLVAFTNIGDMLRLEDAEKFEFSIIGPMAAPLQQSNPEDNLAVRAVRLLGQELNKPLCFKLTLIKNLPVASGIGGGSTDAAAALRLLAQKVRLTPDSQILQDIAALLGQDIPCCIDGNTCYFRDIGQLTDPGPDLPLCHIVMVNPGQGLPTPAVYKARSGPFDSVARLEATPKNVGELAEMLALRTNSLTAAASSLYPEIQSVLEALGRQEGCLLSRMSGSGATCFGLFKDRASAKNAAAHLYREHPDWWVAPAFLPHMPETSRPFFY